MEQNGIRIAFYGKGGIGKSTIAANVSAALAKAGKKVLHIGCDPKSDSTRTLMGRRIPTVLDILRTKEEILAEDLLFHGFCGVSCVESGGPMAGRGCAGKAIALMAQQLSETGIYQKDWDVIIYDVLGDVVCGGFSIPMREHFVDSVYIVTSSEFMSLYAANNILRTIVTLNHDSDIQFGGLIYNQRGSNEINDRVEQFVKKTCSRLVAEVPYSQIIGIAETKGKTVIEHFPKDKTALEFTRLAERVTHRQASETPHVLSDMELEKLCICEVENGR